MSNKNIRPIESDQVFNRLDILLEKMHADFADGVIETEEELIQEFQSVLNEYNKTLQTAHFSPTDVLVGRTPDPDNFNANFDNIDKDLSVLFKEAKNLEDLLISNFNYMVGQGDKINKLSKNISSKVGDLALFSGDPLGKAIYFKDSFNDANKLDLSGTLISTEQAELNDIEGIITLSVERGTDPNVRPNTITINTNSNGTSGNNEESGAALNDEIAVINDSNPDTWFEYEIVSRNRQDNLTLKLDLNFVFDTEEIINFIRINPNNFGTENPIKIEVIETSLDGKDFLSIKDDIPIADFVVEDEENVFELAPSTSKFAGEGFYTFTPRKVKFAHIILTQSNPYVIETNNGSKFRLAIGLRDIDFQKLTYKEESEVVSVPFQTVNEIAKVSLLANESPAEDSDLADIEHFISPDDGGTWYPIQPKARTGTEIAEVRNFNLDIDGSIETSSPVFSIRHRALLARKPAAFQDGAFGLIKRKVPKIDIVQLNSVSPFEINTVGKLADAKVVVTDPNFGSRGKQRPLFQVGVGTGGEANFPIPEEIRDSIDFKDVEIYVDGVKWTRTYDLDVAGSTLKQYRLEGNLIRFGSSGTSSPAPGGSRIAMGLTEEQVFPSIDTDHVFQLKLPSDGDKKNTQIYRLGEPTDVIEQPVLSGSASFSLGKTNISLDEITQKTGALVTTVSPSGGFTTYTEIPFRDGAGELTSASEFSVDAVKGVVYFYVSPTTGPSLPTIGETTISYTYRPKTLVDSNFWDFTTDDTEKRKISLKEEAYEDFEATTISVGSLTKKVTLSPGVVKKSVVFPDSIEVFEVGSPAETLIPEEVPFLDGQTELKSSVQVTELVAFAITDEVTYSPFVKYVGTLAKGANFDPAFKVSLDQGTFQNLKTSEAAVTGDGDYFIDPGNGVITVIGNGLDSNPFSFSYYYKNLDAELNRNTKFSINYETGEMFFGTAVRPGAQIQYSSTNYTAAYNVGRIIDRSTYTVDVANDVIRFAENDILRSLLGTDFNNPGTILKVFYNSVEETRESITELEPHFSPVLKDYALKIITRDKLI